MKNKNKLKLNITENKNIVTVEAELPLRKEKEDKISYDSNYFLDMLREMGYDILMCLEYAVISNVSDKKRFATLRFSLQQKEEIVNVEKDVDVFEQNEKVINNIITRQKKKGAQNGK